ncbi:MAG: hypothetical protein DSY46_06720 [Hydrogenimonas sp.]|nr:MAG: hypothetical protein DSY46_06720 [Hydrogenimonas sp.]
MIQRALLLILLLTIELLAGRGELALYLFKNGQPLAHQKVVIYPITGQPNQKISTTKPIKIVYTDEEGAIITPLKTGKYQLQIFAQDHGETQAFIRKNVMIDEEKQSQIILSLSSDNQLRFSDVEATQTVETVPTKQTVKKAVQKGSVALTLISSEEKQPIVGARIFVPGLKIDAISDKKGQVIIDLPEGSQTLSIIHPDFSSQSVTVTIYPNELTSKRVELTPSAMELEEFVVLAPHLQGSIAAVVAEEKSSESIANILGSEQISKQGDSTAAGALKRVAGVTIIGGKNIYIRGLGDRYSCTELNGMSLPSPNPIKRTVPLDMFPSGVIGSLQVQKSFTPDITGTFGGGYVNIRTKHSSPEDHVTIKVGVKAHESVGQEVTSYEGSTTDWFGYDHAYRPFPDTLNQPLIPVQGERPPTLNISSDAMQKILVERVIDPKQERIPIGVDHQLEVAKTFDLGEDEEISLLGNYGYKTDARRVTYTTYDYIISSNGTQLPEPDNTAVNNLYRTTIQHGGILNVGYKNGTFDAKYTKLYVLNTIDQTRDINGTFGENNSKEHQYFFEWQERELNVDQLSAGVDYQFGVHHRLDVGGEVARAEEYVPNDVYYNYKQYRLNEPYVFEQPDSRLRYSHRTTKDKVKNIFLKNRTDLPMLFSKEDYLELGLFSEQKEREGRRIDIEVQSTLKNDVITSLPIGGTLTYNDGDADHLVVSLTSRPKDQYDASLDRDAYYFKLMSHPTSKLSAMFGGRYVTITQSVDQMRVDQNIVVNERNSLSFKKFLPSVTLKYMISESDQVRFAYGKTFIYPDFREFVNAEFMHPIFLAKISGNPNLVETDIKSYDLRYDHYFGDIDNMSTTLFYKDLMHPIEDTREFTTSTLDRFGFDNAKRATLYGVELGWLKNLSFLTPYFENLTLSGNYTYIKSRIELTEEQKLKYVTQERGLQGLSPYVINLSLTYDIPKTRSINLSYNKMAKRLMRIAIKNGDVILGLDDYEIPPHLLDVTWIEKMRFDTIPGNYAMTFKIRNLLDSETRWVQGDNVSLTYKTGRELSLSISGTF